jgi:hypothetical protein
MPHLGKCVKGKDSLTGALKKGYNRIDREFISINLILPAEA